MDIGNLLELAAQKHASDLHLNVGSPPILRVDGKITRVDGQPAVAEDDNLRILDQITDETQRARFKLKKELDFSYSLADGRRNRVNACVQQGTTSLAFRLLSHVLSPLESLGLPPAYSAVSLKQRGLILVTGPTGSGKTTSLASMIKHINLNQERYIITIEDPIEYLHENIKSVIIQRSVGEDTDSFAEALRGALRHDPDVIVVGEMRDLTTIATALSAAETGHLVLGTLHTLDAPETINRIVDVFPAEQQPQIVLQLSQVLIAVLSQTLVPVIGGGRTPACEVMIANPAIRNAIRQRQPHLMHGIMEMSGKDGMQTLTQNLVRLVREKRVAPKDAATSSGDPDKFSTMLGVNS